MIKFRCSECNRILQVEDQFAGRHVTCPKCKSRLIIPAEPLQLEDAKLEPITPEEKPLGFRDERPAAAPVPPAPAPVPGTNRPLSFRDDRPSDAGAEPPPPPLAVPLLIEPPPRRQQMNWFSIAALGLGGLGCLTSFIPGVNVISIWAGGAGLAAAVIGLIWNVLNAPEAQPTLLDKLIPRSAIGVSLAAVVLALIFSTGLLSLGSDANSGIGSGNDSAASPPASASTTEAASSDDDVSDIPPEPPSEEWTSPDLPARNGYAEVSIESLVVDRVLLKTPDGYEGISNEPLLAVKVRIRNLSRKQKLNYATWRGEVDGDGKAARLNDGLKPLRVVREVGLPRGASEGEIIQPRQSINDIIVFRIPDASKGKVRLELPAGNYGGTGFIRFEIPASRIHWKQMPSG